MEQAGRLPDFLILGAARSGTSSFAAELRNQADIFMPPKRPEPHFFLREAEYAKGLQYYSQRYFAAAPAEALAVGEASTSYLCHRQVAERIARDLPNVRLFAMLRNPIVRAYSSYWHTVKHGYEQLPFWEALQAEPSRAAAAELDPALRENRPFAYLERGLYSRQIRAFWENIPRERLSIILFDDYVVNPSKIVREAMSFLGLDATRYRPPVEFDAEINQSTPAGRVMDDASYEFLREAYREEVRELSELLNRDLSGWLNLRTDTVTSSRAA